MRTIFTSRDVGTLARATAGLEKQASALARASVKAIRKTGEAAVEDWALIGEPEAVADGVRQLREKLGVTHLIARVSVPGVSADDTEASLRLLAELER